MNLSALIQKYFTKQGVNDFTELSPEERATYDTWRETLEAQVTVETLAKFITAQTANLNTELQKAVREGDDRKALLVTARLENYSDLHSVITAPDRNRETLAVYINNLLNHE